MTKDSLLFGWFTPPGMWPCIRKLWTLCLGRAGSIVAGVIDLRLKLELRAGRCFLHRDFVPEQPVPGAPETLKLVKPSAMTGVSRNVQRRN